MLLTIKVYVVVAVGVTVGFATDEVNPSDPVHDHEVALMEFEVR